MNIFETNTDIIEKIKNCYEPKPNISFEDLVGMNSIIDRLVLVSDLRENNAKLYESLHFTNHGFLLYGCSGTGKSEVVHAFANYMMTLNENTKFLVISSSSINSNFSGEAEKSIQAAFNEAIDCSKTGPCILFFEDIDAFVKDRGSENTGISQAELTTEFLISYNRLIDSTAWVIVLATTNSPWKVDNAVISHFKNIYVSLPNAETRAHFIAERLQNVQLEDNLTLEYIVESTEYYNFRSITRLIDQMLKYYIDFLYAKKKQENSEFEALPAVEQDNIIAEIIKHGEFKLSKEHFDAVRTQFSDSRTENQKMLNFIEAQ